MTRTKLENLIPGAQVEGLTADGASVTIEKIDFYGSDAANVLFRDSSGVVRATLFRP